MERLAPTSMTGSFDDGYLQNLTRVISSSWLEMYQVLTGCRLSMPSLMQVRMLCWIRITMEDSKSPFPNLDED